MQTSVNEAPVFTAVRVMPFVFDTYSIGMVGSTEQPYLARSPDSISLIKADGVVSPLLEVMGDILLQLERLWVVPVEIKTKVASSILVDILHLSLADPFVLHLRQ